MLNINKELNGTTLTVILEGRLDTTATLNLEKELKDYLGDVTELIMDFEKLEYISSAGLRVLLSEQKTMSKAEEYIRTHTREEESNMAFDPSYGHLPWLSPEEAREAAKIAREEVIEEVLSIIDNHLGYLEISGGMSLNYKDCIEEIKKFKFKGELIMDRYEEALEKAREAYETYDIAGQRKVLEDIFPELAENKDEEIRKEIISFLNMHLGTSIPPAFSPESIGRWITWLEKQGEKPIDKVERKFKVGDWIVFNGLTLYIKEVVKGYYRTISKDGIPNSYDWNIDSAARLWTIQEAKAGDVLINWNNTIFIFRAIEDETVKFHIAYNEKWDTIKTPSTKLSHLGLPESQFEFHPTTKEQRNTLIKAMADAGYTFDFEKKELKKIEQKSAWSEEDEKVVHCLEYTVKHFYEDEDTIKWCCDWLKPLKDRILPK